MQIPPAAAYKPPVGTKGQDLLNKILKNADKNWAYEHKLDGSRYLAHMHDKGITFTSRRISDVTEQYAEYTGGKLEHLNVAVTDHQGTILDGELMATSAAAMKEGDYQVFDILFYKGTDVRDLPLKNRIPFRTKAVQEIKKEYPNVEIHEVETIPILDANLTRLAYEQHVKAGGEGFVLKNLNSPYLTGSRSRDMWVKWKRSKTYDVIIQGHQKSDSDKYGPNGLDTFRHLYGYQYDKSGTLCLVSNIPATSWTDDQHKEFKKIGIDALDGRIAEVGAMERASKGVKLRHPRFIRWRDDKNAEDCKISDNDEDN